MDPTIPDAAHASPPVWDALSTWTAPRTRVLKAIGVGTGSYPFVFAALWTLWPEGSGPVAMADRLGLAAQLCVAPAVVVFAVVCGCFRLFDTARAEDPFANAESDAWKINARVLQNSVEQALIFIPLLVGTAARLPPEHAKLLPIATLLWCAGRLLFWAGYRIRPDYRALGFDWTMWTSAALLVAFVGTLLVRI